MQRRASTQCCESDCDGRPKPGEFTDDVIEDSMQQIRGSIAGLYAELQLRENSAGVDKLRSACPQSLAYLKSIM